MEMKFGTKAHCFTRDSGDFCLAGSRKPDNVFPSIHPSSAVRDEGVTSVCRFTPHTCPEKAKTHPPKGTEKDRDRDGLMEYFVHVMRNSWLLFSLLTSAK